MSEIILVLRDILNINRNLFYRKSHDDQGLQKIDDTSKNHRSLFIRHYISCNHITSLLLTMKTSRTVKNVGVLLHCWFDGFDNQKS